MSVLLILSILSIPFMTIMSRASGGGWPKIPWGLDQFILALPYLIFIPQVGWWIIPAYLGAVLGLRMGHGRGFHYNLPFEVGSKPERAEAVIPDRIPVYWQKFLIMTLTGLSVTLVLAASLAFYGHIIPAIVLLLSGSFKALAYLLPKTEWSELARGLFLGLGVFLACILL